MCLSERRAPRPSAGPDNVSSAGPRALAGARAAHSRLPRDAAGETASIMGQQCAPVLRVSSCSPLYLLSLERQPFPTMGRPSCFRGSRCLPAR